MGKQKGKVFIGTSNVVIPGNKAGFPEAFRSTSRLHYYGHLFNSVEVNSSFYKIPQSITCVRWASEVPADFRFSFKLHRDITHSKHLKSDLDIIDKFIQSVTCVGKKKGCILIQFPGKITLDYFNEVEQILSTCASKSGRDQWRTAVEFRHTSWYIGETWELLNEFGAAAVQHDIAKGKLLEPMTNADFIYLRFHGPTGNYRDSYSESFLKEKAAATKSWLLTGKDVYAYFNNTIGDAFGNALTLQSLVGSSRKSK